MMKESVVFQWQQVETIKKMKETAEVQATTIHVLRAELTGTQRKQSCNVHRALFASYYFRPRSYWYIRYCCGLMSTIGYRVAVL